MSLMRWWAEVSGSETGSRPRTVLLILDPGEEAGAGYFITGFDATGRETMDAWFGGRDLARGWAIDQHPGADIGPWVEIPADVTSPFAYALRAMGRHPIRRGRRHT